VPARLGGVSRLVGPGARPDLSVVDRRRGSALQLGRPAHL